MGLHYARQGSLKRDAQAKQGAEPQEKTEASKMELVHPENLKRPKKSEVRILLVEDDAADALLTRHALDATHIPYSLSRIRRGDEVLPRLLSLTCTEMPDVIMLDLGLPGMDGFELMETMTRMPNYLRRVPIVIITAYQGFSYLDKNYPLLIKKYVTKPCAVEAMQEVLQNTQSAHLLN